MNLKSNSSCSNLKKKKRLAKQVYVVEKKFNKTLIYQNSEIVEMFLRKEKENKSSILTQICCGLFFFFRRKKARQMKNNLALKVTKSLHVTLLWLMGAL